MQFDHSFDTITPDQSTTLGVTGNLTVSGTASSPSGDFNLKGATALADAAVVITAAQMEAGLFTITPTTARILTTDTAASIIAGLPGYQIGSQYIVSVINLAAFDVTLSPGASVTIVGKNIVNNGTGVFQVVITSATTVSIYSLATAVASAGGSGIPVGATSTVQYNNAGAFGGAANVEIHGGDVQLTLNAAPTTPPTNRIKLFNKQVGTRNLLAQIGPSGLDMAMQPGIYRNKVGYWCPPGTLATLPGVMGYGTPTALGTATARAIATTTVYTYSRRLAYLSSTTVGNFAGFYVPAAQVGLGMTIGAVPAGGFFKVVRFGIGDAAAVSGARMFVGMSSAVSAPTNVEPSTLINSVGVGHGAADTNLKIFYGGSAAQTPIDLGASFPLTINQAVMYELALFCPPGAGGNYVGYQVTNITTGATASGTLTAASAGVQLPLNTTLMSFARHWRCNNATALAVTLDIFSDYIETDN